MNSAGSNWVTDRFLPPIVRFLEGSLPGRACLRAYRQWANPRDPHKPRVLCVGFQKTGTTSFARALRQLGFSHYGYDPDLHQSLREGDIERCLRFAAGFDSLDDLPWSDPAFVAAWRERFPGTRFVLLERDERQWLRSYFAFFRPDCSEAEALRRLHAHNARILELLADEPHVLRMNVCNGEGYEKLCPFLGLPIPTVPFPWENRTRRDPGS